MVYGLQEGKEMSFAEDKRADRIATALESIAECLYVIAMEQGRYEHTSNLRKPTRGSM